MKAAQVVNLFSEGVNLHIEPTQIEDASEHPDNYRGGHAGGSHDDAGQDKRSVHNILSCGTEYTRGTVRRNCGCH